MKPGDVVRVRTIRHHAHGDGRSWREYSPDNRAKSKEGRKVFVAILLGDEHLDSKYGEPLDILAVMDELGWRMKNEDDGPLGWRGEQQGADRDEDRRIITL